MTDSTVPRSSALATWGFAFAVAILGNYVLWKTDLGINWGLCVTVAVTALIVVARARYGHVGAPSLVAGAWAVVLAFGAAVTTDGLRLTLLVLATLVLLAIALVTAGRRSVAVLVPRLAIAAPLVAIGLTLAGLLDEVTGTARVPRSPRRSAMIRSALITVPVVLVLILLLGDADPLFAAMRSELGDLLPIDDPARMIFFFLLLAIALGAYGSVSRGAAEKHVTPADPGLAVGRLEGRVLMTAVATVMWLFAISATISLLKNPAARAGSGITYAEYARRGFAELSLAATIVIGAVLATRRAWLRDDVPSRRIAIGALAGVGAMLVIAFVRVVRYEQAYGFTVARLYAQGYMLVLACALVLLLIEIHRRAPSSRFAYHAATAALAIFATCVFWNTDAWIVRRNVDRYRTTGKIDVDYLTERLSSDATPALIASLPVLKEPERTAVIKSLLEIPGGWSSRDSRWFAWNLRANGEVSALRKWYRETQPNGPAPS